MPRRGDPGVDPSEGGCRDAPGGGQIGTLGGGCVEDEVKRKAAGMVGQDGAELHSFVLNHDYAWADGLICGGKMVILAECPRGPGHLAYYRAYRELLDAGRGFTEAIVLDPRRSGASAVGDRFLFDDEGRTFASLAGGDPTAGPMGEILPRLEITSHTYALIVTRDHGYDQEALQHLAPTVAPYVGLIGSRRKIRMIFDALLDEGVEERVLARVSAPVGLDIGAAGLGHANPV